MDGPTAARAAGAGHAGPRRNPRRVQGGWEAGSATERQPPSHFLPRCHPPPPTPLATGACRWFAYQVLSGAIELELHYAGLYSRLLDLGRAPPQFDVVMRNDCHRTLPYMPFFG
jgi:hypothetical protein